MLKFDYVNTKQEIVDAEISKDSTRVLTVVKASEKEYWVKMFNMETLEMQFSEQILGNYIKVKLIS